MANYQWIEYSLLWIDGLGIQPYETLQSIGAHFDGGHYTQSGRYRGRLITDSTTHRAAALSSLSVFGAQTLSNTQICDIVETVTPTNTQIGNELGGPTRYIGPPTLDAELNVVRALSNTPFNVPPRP